MNDIEGLVRGGPLRKYQDKGGRVNQFDTLPRCQKKRKRQVGGGSCNSGVDKKDKREDDDDGDGDYQFEGIIAAISSLPQGKTKSSLKAEARTPPPSDPVNKRFKREESILFSEKDPVPPVVPHHDAIITEAVVVIE